jgi:2'-5' RNA ligase
MYSRHAELLTFYDSLWQEALHGLASRRIETDPYLTDKRHDRRRGLTVIARPDQRTIDRFTELLRQLASIAPDEYYYQPSEIHITILSLFTATEHFESYFAKVPLYLAALQPVLSRAKRFTVAFNGVTASRSAVLVQGFPESAYLTQLREELREALHNAGLGEGLDRRYRIKTAHATILRFRTQPRDTQRLIDILAAHRGYHFGETTFQTLQVVKNDWYMSSDIVDLLAEYQLL